MFSLCFLIEKAYFCISKACDWMVKSYVEGYNYSFLK